MQSANTVFLKHKHNKKNISLKSKHVKSTVNTVSSNPSLALFGFTNESWFGNSSIKKGLPKSIKQSEIDFKRETVAKNKLNFIWQPLSKNFWRQLRLRSNIPLDLTKRKIYTQLVLNGAMIGAILGTFCIYFGISIGILSSIAGLCMGAYFGKYRYQYLNYAKNQKSALIKNRQAAQETSEQEAFKAGVDAKNWRGYYTSYVNFSTYKHPLAFAAGLKTGMDEDIECSSPKPNKKAILRSS